MKIQESKHLRLQQQVDCFLEADAKWELAHFVQAGATGDEHEDALKFLALLLIHAMEERASGIILEPGHPTIFVVEGSHVKLPAVQENVMRHSREILCQIAGVEGEITRSPLILGIRGESMEFQIEKNGDAVAINLPPL
ncbi:MAG: hypothetical protein JRG73_02740 [Deltaproteobacteria bacterium]|nr:hypothetical protein [Deltaproteobacteria bacterium]